MTDWSLRMRPGDYRAVTVADDGAPPRNTREWLHRAHDDLRELLPDKGREALLTEDLASHGRPNRIGTRFGVPRPWLRTILFNPEGLWQSVRAMRPAAAADSWPGFRDVQISVGDGISISARLGLVERFGRPARADCVVVVPGLLGDNRLARTRDLCDALRRSGVHALAVEPRGYGQTLARNPHVGSTFGVMETLDLLAIADWLERKPYVRETGLIGFCWGANEALLVAWENGRRRDDPDVVARLRPHLDAGSGTTHYRAGIIAFSPVLRFEDLIEQLERPLTPIDLVLMRVGGGVRELGINRKHHNPGHSLRSLIQADVARSELDYPGIMEDGLRYLRFLPFRGNPVNNKLDAARVPVLIVHAANDPLGSAQDVADLCSRLSNPRVAALILPGGGHNGFAVYDRAYYYSLVLNFFDSEHGPRPPSSNFARSSPQGEHGPALHRPEYGSYLGFPQR